LKLKLLLYVSSLFFKLKVKQYFKEAKLIMFNLDNFNFMLNSKTFKTFIISKRTYVVKKYNWVNFDLDTLG
jgi:hypothetical protein